MIDTSITTYISPLENTSSIMLPEKDTLLTPLSSHPWALWNWVGLRGAGFPANLILQIVPPEIASAANKLLEIESKVEQVQQHALATLSDERDSVNEEQRTILQKAYWRIRKGKLPQPFAFACASQVAVEAYRAARTQQDEAHHAFEEAYSHNIIAERRAIRTVVAREDFREAITWQNRSAMQQGINLLSSRPEEVHDSKQKQYERLAVNYIQRYSMKNDSIGFFGPIGWIRLDASASTLEVQPGPGLVSTRNVYFESWCLDALAETVAQNRELKRWFVPRRVPTIDLQGNKLFSAFGHSTQLLPIQTSVLKACDGIHTAQEIATSLLKNAGKRFKNEREVYSVLEYLRSKGLIHWTFDVPYVLRPEQPFQEGIERIQDQQLRLPLQQAYDELIAGQQKVAQAAGNADQLATALDQLDETFTRLTGKTPNRLPGQTYAGRTLVFEDCQRDIEVKMGPAFIKDLEPTLVLLLTSARWFTFETAKRYRIIFKQLYDELVASTHTTSIDTAVFWTRAYQYFFEEKKQNALDDLENLFHEHWHSLFKIQPDQHRLTFSSQELSSQVQSIFAAPHAGWKSAHFHSPDVLIAANSVDAIRQGDYQLVMGELHIARNTLDTRLFVQQHPAPEELFQMLELSLSEPRILPIIPKQWPRLTSRTLPACAREKDWRLVFSHDASIIDPDHALPIGSLLIEEDEQGLSVRTRDGQKQFDIIEVFSEALSILVVNSFGLLHHARHTPRVTIDRTVVCRESWRLPIAEMPFAKESNEQERFLSVRRWAHTHNIPRHIFVKVPDEIKPFYVDLDSPILIDIFAKALRRVGTNLSEETTITMSEMLPGHGDAWLPDLEGNLFTSELRFVAVDMAQTS